MEASGEPPEEAFLYCAGCQRARDHDTRFSTRKYGGSKRRSVLNTDFRICDVEIATNPVQDGYHLDTGQEPVQCCESVNQADLLCYRNDEEIDQSSIDELIQLTGLWDNKQSDCLILHGDYSGFGEPLSSCNKRNDLNVPSGFSPIDYKYPSFIPCQHHTSKTHKNITKKSSIEPEITAPKPGSKHDSAYASLERHVTPSQCYLKESNVTSCLSLDSGYRTDHVTTLICSVPGDEDSDRDSGTEECSSGSDSDDTVVLFEATNCTKEKLNQRTKEMLIVLRDQYVKLIQEVSEQLVQLLQERHDLKEQVDMRKIAIEQLVRFQSETFVSSRDQDSVQMSVCVPGDE